MLGLFGTMNMGARALQAQSQGLEVAGHNLANASTPGYSRQRIQIVTNPTINSPLGPQGTGVQVTGITQMRDVLLDRQTEVEISVTGSLEAQQAALQYAQAGLGEEIDRQASANGASTTDASGQHGIAADLSNLFNAFQSVATDPTSLANRQVLLMKAQDLASKFNTVDQRLGALDSSLNTSITSDVKSANDLLQEIAKLNDQISNTENGNPGSANDLRDTRQLKIEALAKLVKVDVTPDSTGAIDISIGGTSLVQGPSVAEHLEAYDPGTGNLMVRAQSTGTPLTLTGGSIQGSIDARDGAIANLRGSLNTLASQLITQVNAIHTGGFGLGGSTGAKFFNGSTAADISVNSALISDPSLFQAASAAGAAGDNTKALALAQLAAQSVGALGNQTFSQNYNQTVAAFGQSLASVNQGVSDQQVVQNMLQQQRDSVSGVSLDEEMTDLMKFQRAYQASAKLITTVDDMLETVIGMKR
ncbi:MAG TPA: flagellar hook-associated protein FlgK [Verrucomicrobiae bacterium]|nr:flagellar hook-associated protein FlgK [Verrucomicrobiae bacterium]